MPMDENILTFNVTNWMTVILMLAIAGTLSGLAISVWKSRNP